MRCTTDGRRTVGMPGARSACWHRSQGVRDGRAMTRAMLLGERGAPPPRSVSWLARPPAKSTPSMTAGFTPKRGEGGQERYRREDTGRQKTSVPE